MKGRRLVRLSVVGLAGGMAMVALMLLLAPLSAGLSAPGSINAPYVGSAWSASDSQYSSGCATASHNASKWASSTGIGHLLERVKGSPCSATLGTVGASSSSYANGSITIGVPVTVSTNGTHSFVVHWVVAAPGGHRLTPGSCRTSSAPSRSCYQIAGWEMSGGAYLQDLTTGAVFNSTNSWDWENKIYNTTFCSPTCYTYTATYGYGHGWVVTFFINGTLSSSDSYVLVTSISASTYVSFSTVNTTISGGYGSASVNAWGSHKVTLKNILMT